MEATNGLDAGASYQQAPASVSPSNSGMSYTDNSVQQPTKTFSQDELNEIVKRVKSETAERVERRYTQQQPQQQYQAPQQTQQPTEADYRRWAAEEAQRIADSRSQNDATQRVLSSFANKVLPAKEKYKDFDKVTENLGIQRFPYSLQLLAENVDNAGDLVYELGKDRAKLADIERDCRDGFSDIALQKLQKLSQSIKDNENASKMRTPKEPLSQLQGSTLAMDAEGDLPSVRELKKVLRW